VTITANENIVGGAEAQDGWLEATAVGFINGVYAAFDEVVLHAGGPPT
jgi:hypothetical protein